MADPIISADGNTIDVAGLLGRLKGFESQVAASQADLNAVLATARGAAGAAAGGASLEAQGQIAVNTEVQRAAIKKQADDAAAAAAVGMTPGAPSDLIIATINNLQGNQADLLARGRMIADKQQQEFFDDPLQWLTNQFALPFDIAAYNAKIAQQDRDFDFLSGMSKIFDDQARVNAAVDVATGQSLLDGLNRIALGKAQSAAAGSQMELARLGLNIVNMRANMSDQILGNYLKAMDYLGREQSRIQEERRLKLSEEAGVRAEETLKLQRAEADARATEIARKESGRRFLQERINTATNVIGMTAISVDDYLMDPNIQKRLAPFMLSPEVMTGTLGSTPAQALDMVQGFPLTPGNELTRRWGEATNNATVTAAAAGTGWRNLGAEAQEELKTKKLLEAANRERANIPESGGLYSLPPLKSVLTMRSLMTEDGKQFRFSILEDMLPLVRADENIATKPELFVAAAAARIRDGKATVDQMALELSNIYRAMGMDNNLLRGYNKFNLPVLAADNGGFKQQLNLTGVFGGSTVVDFMNAPAVRNALQRYMARTKPRMGTVPNN